MARALPEPSPDPPERGALAARAAGVAIDNPLDCLGAVPPVWHKKIGKLVVDSAAILASEPSDAYGAFVPGFIHVAPHTAANDAKPAAAARAAQLFHAPQAKFPGLPFRLLSRE
jgi:hypothetical protein